MGPSVVQEEEFQDTKPLLFSLLGYQKQLEQVGDPSTKTKHHPRTSLWPVLVAPYVIQTLDEANQRTSTKMMCDHVVYFADFIVLYQVYNVEYPCTTRSKYISSVPPGGRERWSYRQ